MEEHLAALNDETAGFKVLIALSKFESEQEERFQRIREVCMEKYKRSIAFETVSFETFVKALNLPHMPKNLADAVQDFRLYIDEEGFLPSWQGLLDVVNCAGIPEDVLKANVYMCPATGGAYNHRRCKFFGMYQDKSVRAIATIEAVVEIHDSESASVKWRNVAGKKEEFIKKARARLDERRPGQYPTRVFLLGPLYNTNYRKNSPGGMQTSKMYFSVGELNAPDAEALAIVLNGRTWLPEVEVLADCEPPAGEDIRFGEYAWSVPSDLPPPPAATLAAMDPRRFMAMALDPGARAEPGHARFLSRSRPTL